MGNDVEQRLAKVEMHVADIESARASERREYLDVMERIFSKLNDLHTRITVQQQHTEDLAAIRKDIRELQQERSQVVGGWKALGIVATAMAALGAAIAYAFEHLPRILKSLNSQ